MPDLIAVLLNTYPYVNRIPGDPARRDLRLVAVRPVEDVDGLSTQLCLGRFISHGANCFEQKGFLFGSQIGFGAAIYTQLRLPYPFVSAAMGIVPCGTTSIEPNRPDAHGLEDNEELLGAVGDAAMEYGRCLSASMDDELREERIRELREKSERSSTVYSRRCGICYTRSPEERAVLSILYLRCEPSKCLEAGCNGLQSLQILGKGRQLWQIEVVRGRRGVGRIDFLERSGLED
ncbi:hypothetical protein PRIPAC_94728 [Pristionchus pacificus]|uniref:Uncharacterized protein n=1 Tax=Pristionchus pacificus TaxID=54126 RepID=A0A2A6CD10_PRIPA|nr:hypothetical protein PRIPAC_94728 [Pristionchus pacificus]|eukprot:PDM76006.1 hypothetical protein PRIPAC_39610 [Pristionchus pacificus]